LNKTKISVLSVIKLWYFGLPGHSQLTLSRLRTPSCSTKIPKGIRYGLLRLLAFTCLFMALNKADFIMGQYGYKLDILCSATAG
jgi:hypothetical protein